jgi:hypothetical protein
MNQPPKPQGIPFGPFQIFRKLAEIFTAQFVLQVSLSPVANKKIFNQKSFNYFVLTPLGNTLELTNREFFYFKFTLRCQQSAVVPNICWHWWKICHCCQWLQWYQWQNLSAVTLIQVCTFTCEYLREKIRNDPIVIFRALGEDDS